MINRQCRTVLLPALLSLFSITSCVSNSGKAQPSENTPSAALSEQAFNNLVTKGDEALSRRAYSDAQVQYSLAIKEQPKNTDLLYKLAIVHYEKNSFDVATELLRAIVDADTKHVGAHEMLGLIALKNENIEIAELRLNKALSLDANRWRSQNAMGIVKDMRSLHIDAQQHFQQTLNNNPNKAKTENNLGYSHYLNGNYQQAERHFRNATRLNPDYEKAWANLGLVYIRMKQYEDARYAFSKVVEDHVASNNIGYLAMLQGDDNMARQELARAILLAPTYYPKASENQMSLENRDGSFDRFEPTKYVMSPDNNGNKSTSVNTESLTRTDARVISSTGPIQQIQANAMDSNNSGTVQRAPVVIKESAYRAPVTEQLTTKSTIKNKSKAVPTGERLSRHYLQILGHKVRDESKESLHNPLLSFQASHELEPTGTLDRPSMNLLTAEAIQRVKSLLVSLNYEANIDSREVGAETVNSLKSFQKDNALPITGKIDPSTLSALTRYLNGGDVALNPR